MSISESNAGRLKFFLKDLNSHLVCPLCEGYFREAHTVPDCLHTFCKSCLFKEFAKKALKDAKSCPSCKFNLGLRPYEKVVYDRNLQALVDKIFPHFALQDKILEDQFYAACDKEDAASVNAPERPRLLPPPTNKRSLPNAESDHPPKKFSGAANQSSCSSLQASSSSGTGAVKKVGTEEVVDGANALTLRVEPLDASLTSPGSPSALLTLLPALTRPLLRVTSKSVSVAKIQRFIHRRMGENVAFPPEDIEVLRDGVVQSATALISRLDKQSSGGETSTSTSSDLVVNLQYRKILRSA